MEFKLLPNLFRRRRVDADSPVAHAISGSTAATSGMFGSVFAGNAGGWDVQRAVYEGLERVLWVYRCCDAIASNFAKLHQVVRQGDPEDGRIIDDPRIGKLLNRRPNIHETAFDFKYRLAIQLLLSKRGAFIEVVPDNFGRPKALELLPPHLVEPIPDASTFVSGYRLLNQVTLEETILPRKRVIWIRTKPHPTDPYLQLTPLTAAGLVVDSDWLARIYNRNFLVNDGRPGLLIAIRGRMNQPDAEEVKRRFGGGPQNAGQVTVVEADDVNAQDLSANPRDMQYLEMLRGAKEDILLAFGTPESVLGNASGRTYDNADAEKENWWEETMMSFCDGITRGLDPLTGDIDDELFISNDYDVVDVLQRRKKERHDKMAAEYAAGTLTLDEYLVGVGRKAINVPASRVYFHTSGAIIGQPDDVQAVAKLPVIGVEQTQQGQMQLQKQSAELGGGMGGYPGASGGGDQIANNINARDIADGGYSDNTKSDSAATRAAKFLDAIEVKALPRYAHRESQEDHLRS